MTPDPTAAVIHTLGELDNTPAGQPAPVTLTGPTTPPYDHISAALDRAHRIGLTTHTITTDGTVHTITNAVRALAAELGYNWRGHPYAGRHEPHNRVRTVDRNSRLYWHLRATKVAGLPDNDITLLHNALNLPEPDRDFERSCDELDEHNAANARHNLTGIDPATGATWQIIGPPGLHWPAFTVKTTLPDGRELTSRADLRDYITTHLANILATQEEPQS